VEQTPVPCLDCRRLVTGSKSRARRIGDKCWRKRRRAARQAASLVAQPGMSGQGARPGLSQSGPDLFDIAATDAEEVDPS